MAAVSSAQTDRIVSFCKTAIDPESLKGIDFTLSTREYLDKLSGEVNQCAAVVLTGVTFRKASCEIVGPLVVGNSQLDLAQAEWKIDEAMVGKIEENADFYLLFGGRVVHIQMDVSSDSLLELALDARDPKVWCLSSGAFKQMLSQSWNNSFVTATYTWDKVIPL